jgi:glycosyltransferase involved in cell wall biosynthesis
MPTAMRHLLAPRDETVRPGQTPSFSIAIAAYQAADVIGEAIESALAQTVPPAEIVVCDDGSTDDLGSALAPYRDRIVLLRKQNGGEASAKNAAARAASGDFISILDADDVYFPDRLAALGELAAARPDLDILTTDAYLELDGARMRRVYEGDWTFEVDDQRRAILERNFIFGLAAVRRERLLATGGFDETIRWTTDWECWARLILEGARAGAVLEPLALYRLRPTSLSSDREKLVAGRLRTLEKTSTHPSLSIAERRAVATAIATNRRELALLELRAALAEHRRDSRRLAIAVARSRSYPQRTRLKALIAAGAPRLAGRILRGRLEHRWTGASGIEVAREPEASVRSEREPARR